MNKKRIVVTGMGVVSCFGQNVDNYYDKLLAGVSGVSAITRFPCDDFSTRFAAQVQDFDPSEMDKKQARRVDPCIAYAIDAGKKALRQAGLLPVAHEQLNKKRCGVIIGSGMGGMGVFSDGVKTLLEKGNRRITPFLIPYILTNMPGALLAMDFGFMGPNYSVSTACATSNYAIIQAAQHIRNNESDLVIAGGVEAPILPIGLGGFCAVKALSERNDDFSTASRPYDKDRDGFVLGEGAGALILEEYEHAKARGAKIYAEIVGTGLSADAYHITAPHPDGIGAKAAMELALEEANMNPDQIDYINTHGTSTPLGDIAEIKAIQHVFGEDVYKLNISSTKSMTGHLLGAAGAIESIAGILGMNHHFVPPTINHVTDDPALDPKLNFTFNEAQEKVINAFISNTFGFGGHNSSVIFKRC